MWRRAVGEEVEEVDVVDVVDVVLDAMTETRLHTSPTTTVDLRRRN